MISPSSPITTESQRWFDAAAVVTPGGVNSPVRAFNAVGGVPRFMVRGQGPYLFDVDGQQYVDLICSWGPLLHGHAHPAVQDAVMEAVSAGTSYGTPTLPEVQLAEEIVARTSVDQVRFVSSGTEATMSAIRLARAATGREIIVKFAGCYHGHVDALLAAAGSGLATLSIPGTPGVPEAVAAATVVLPYNDRDAVQEAFAKFPGQIAAVITEAAPGNMGMVPPAEGFNRFLSEQCRSDGALLISDEVMTGFRIARSGQWGRDGAVEGWEPDLVTFGKVIGGGFPAAAFGGRREVMSLLAPLGPVYQAGTLSGNPVATTAGLATLRLSDEHAYGQLEDLATSLVSEVSDALSQASVPHVAQRAGTMFSFFLGVDQPVTNFAQAQAMDLDTYRAFFHAMLAQGVYLPPSAFEVWFLSTAHDSAAVDRIVSALPAAARAAAVGVPS